MPTWSSLAGRPFTVERPGGRGSGESEQQGRENVFAHDLSLVDEQRTGPVIPHENMPRRPPRTTAREATGTEGGDAAGGRIVAHASAEQKRANGDRLTPLSSVPERLRRALRVTQCGRRAPLRWAA